MLSIICPALFACAFSLNTCLLVHSSWSIQCSCPGLLACASSQVGGLLMPCARCINEQP